MRRFLMILLALLLPPVAVYARAGTGVQLYANLFLCFAFYLPAVVHAVWFVRRPMQALAGGGTTIDDESAAAVRREPTLD